MHSVLLFYYYYLFVVLFYSHIHTKNQPTATTTPAPELYQFLPITVWEGPPDILL